MTPEQCTVVHDHIIEFKNKVLHIMAGIHQCRCGTKFNSEHNNTHIVNGIFSCAPNVEAMDASNETKKILLCSFPNHTIVVKVTTCDPIARIKFGMSESMAKVFAITQSFTAQEKARVLFETFSHFEYWVKKIADRHNKRQRTIQSTLPVQIFDVKKRIERQLALKDRTNRMHKKMQKFQQKINASETTQTKQQPQWLYNLEKTVIKNIIPPAVAKIRSPLAKNSTILPPEN